MQSQKAVTAYLKSKQLLPFGFAQQHDIKLSSTIYLNINDKIVASLDILNYGNSLGDVCRFN